MLFSSGRKYRLNSEGSGTLQNILDAEEKRNFWRKDSGRPRCAVLHAQPV